MDAPREDLTRAFSFTLDRAAVDGDGLTLSGYAAVFNSPTLIDSWEGRFEEVVAPGAFKRTIAAKSPVLMFDHGKHPMVGTMPLGKPTFREDAKGLHVEARLSDNWLIQPVRDAIAVGAIDGMSFRFSVVSDEWQQRQGTDPLRTLREVKCSECGPVVFPAYADTSVSVRSLEIASLLADPTVRVEVARALLLGTLTEPAPEGTSVADPPVPDPPLPALGFTPNERARVLALLDI